jgi:hypothetical protein
VLHDNWSVAGTWAYIDSKVTKFVDDFDGDGSLSPRPDELIPLVMFAPENEWTLSLNYDQEFSNFRLAGTMMYHWIDEMYGNDKSTAEVYDEISTYGLTYQDAAAYTKAHTSDAYGTVNINLTASTLDDLYSISLWGRNILDERAAANGIGFIAGNSYQYATVTHTEPLTWGVTLKANF